MIMARNSVNCSIVMSFVVTFLLILSNYYDPLQHGAIAEIVLSPWDDYTATTVNRSKSCEIYSTDEKQDTVVILGTSSSSPCKFKIASDDTGITAFGIQILSYFANDYFLYVKRIESSTASDHCVHYGDDADIAARDFAVINGGVNGSQCATFVPLQNFHFYLRGINASVQVRELPSQDTSSDCFDELGTSVHPSPSSPTNKCSVTWYNDVINCDTGAATCDLTIPDYCTASLGHRQMNLICSKDARVTQQRVIWIYPDVMSVLDAADNNIVAIDENAFQEMGDSLEILLLQNNKLRTLNPGAFNNLKNLLTLDLHGNSLISLQPGCFQGLEKLSELDLSANMMSSIPVNAFQNLLNLKELILEDNQLDFLNSSIFSGLNKLKSLNLEGNSLISLHVELFQGLSRLEKLDLDENQLTALEVGLFHGLSNLRDLSLQRNRLNSLELEGNSMKSLPVEIFQGLGRLEDLDLDGNELSTLEVGLFHGLDNLVDLSIQVNRLSSLGVGLFHGLTNLIELDLDDNQIPALEAGLFHGLINLEELDIDYNMISAIDIDVFQGLTSLMELDLDFNLLTRFEVGLFDGLSQLVYLDLDNNYLETVDVGVFRDLSTMNNLWMAQNKLVTLDVDMFQGLENLKELYLHYNLLESLEVGIFDGLTHLVELVLSDNRLTTISADLFQGLHNLSSLRLDGNQITSLPSGIFRGMFNLKKLYLNKNEISYLEAEIFNGLINLDTLTLQHNRLKSVDVGLLRSTVRLGFLDLSDNALQTIPDIAHLTELYLVILNNNSLLRVDSHVFSGLRDGVQLLASQHEICQCYVPDNTSCSASFDRSPYLTCHRLLDDGTLVIMMWFIGISALCGNTFVLFWRNNHLKRNKVQSVLLRNLAMSDMQMGVYMLMIACADIYFGDEFPMAAESWRRSITCKIAGALSILSSEASVFFVVVISVDRLVSTKYPQSKFKFGNKSVVVVVVVVWVFAAVLSIVPSVLAGRNANFYDNSHVCVGLPLTLTETFSTNTTTKEVASIKYNTHIIEISQAVSNGQKPGMYFSTAVFLGVNSICYLVILCCYVVIIQTVRVSSKRAGLTREMKNQIRLTIKVSAIVATDFLCWSPIILLGILVQCQVLTLPPSVFAWSVTFVLPINSAINPYMYTIADIISIRRKRLRGENEVSTIQTKQTDDGRENRPTAGHGSMGRGSDDNSKPRGNTAAVLGQDLEAAAPLPNAVL